MYYSVNYLKLLFLKVVTLSKSLSQIETSVVFYDFLIAYVFYTKHSFLLVWLWTSHCYMCYMCRSQPWDKIYQAPWETYRKILPQPCKQAHGPHSTQSHTNVNLCACNRKDLLCWSNPINYKLEPTHICVSR